MRLLLQLHPASYTPKRQELARRWLLKRKGHLIEHLCFKKRSVVKMNQFRSIAPGGSQAVSSGRKDAWVRPWKWINNL